MWVTSQPFNPVDGSEPGRSSEPGPVRVLTDKTDRIGTTTEQKVRLGRAKAEPGTGPDL